MSGPPPKPTAQKRLEGNPGKRKLNDAEPMPGVASLKAPSYLSTPAKAIWRKLAPMSARLGLLTEADEPEFARMCALMHEERTLRKLMGKEGMFVQETVLDKHGEAIEKTKKHPAWQVLRQVECSLTPLCDRFGLNPSSRSRIKVGANDGKPDAFEELLNRVRNARNDN